MSGCGQADAMRIPAAGYGLKDRVARRQVFPGAGDMRPFTCDPVERRMEVHRRPHSGTSIRKKVSGHDDGR